MLRSRQVKILATISSFEYGISVSDLSSLINCSEKTIRNEIRAINETLDKLGKIVQTEDKMYVLDQNSNELYGLLKNAYRNNIEEFYDFDRTHRVLLLLFFEDDYISMESLSEKLFISKSALSKLFGTSWRLRKYVEVNPVRGLLIKWDERKKRDYISKTSFLSSSFFSYLEGSDQYHDLAISLSTDLSKLFLDHQYYISGDSLNLFRFYLVITIMRSKYSSDLNNDIEIVQISSLMNDIIQLLESKYRISLSEFDIYLCQNKINELNVLVNLHKDLDVEIVGNLNHNYKMFLHTMDDTFNISVQLDEQQYNQFLLHMYKLLIRTQNNTDVQNFSKRSINTDYPLTALIMRDVFCNCFNIRIPESELAFIMLYFANSIEPKEVPMKILHISDAPASLINDSRWKIESINHGSFTSTPSYSFDKLDLLEYDVVITDVFEVLIDNPKILLVSQLISSNELEIIGQYLKAVRSKMRDANIAVITTHYYTEKDLVLKSMMEFIEANDVGDIDTYDFVLNDNWALFMKIDVDTDSLITNYELKTPVLYKNHSISNILQVSYNPNSNIINPFFIFIKKLINS